MATVAVGLQTIHRDQVLPLLKRDVGNRSWANPFPKDEDLFIEAYDENVHTPRPPNWRELAAADCCAFKNGGPLPHYVETALHAIAAAGK